MLDESLALLAGAAKPAGATFVDATFGAGGHTTAILERVPDSRVIALDTDPAAFDRARALAGRYRGRLIALHANFASLETALAQLGIDAVDGVMYDLGLSSLQLDDAARGLSFTLEGPLDLRLDPQSEDPTAAELLATLPEEDLAALIRRYGDDRNARRIARQIARRRQRSPLRTTSDLVAAVLSAQPSGRRHQRIHPATRTFLALRIAVNRELERLAESLEQAVRRTRSRGRIVVISFHSGEDRVTKHAFAAWQRFGIATMLARKPIRPSPAEIAANPRSRSAKLRAAQKMGS